MGIHSLLQGIFPTQGLNPGLHCRQTLYHLIHQGSPQHGFPIVSGTHWKCPVDNGITKYESDFYMYQYNHYLSYLVIWLSTGHFQCPTHSGTLQTHLSQMCVLLTIFLKLKNILLWTYFSSFILFLSIYCVIQARNGDVTLDCSSVLFSHMQWTAKISFPLSSPPYYHSLESGSCSLLEYCNILITSFLV